jgi:hypothetical protein
MQNIDASGIPVLWSVSWGVASKAAIPLSFPTRTFPKLDRFWQSGHSANAQSRAFGDLDSRPESRHPCPHDREVFHRQETAFLASFCALACDCSPDSDPKPVHVGNPAVAVV